MHPTLAQALADKGYDSLTPVQEAVTDPALSDRDLLVSAQTGSGKTVGFGLAIATTLLGDEPTFGPAAAPLALVIAPTRELAMQVKRELAWLYAGAGVVMAQAVGGMDMRDERRALDRGAHIVVATPGRLKDHILRGSLQMSDIRALVLDEADEMLDLGFREDLEFILSEAPEDRRTLLFSATVPPTIVKLAQSYQRNAERISTINRATQHADIEYRALTMADHDQDNAIINVLRYYEAPNAIVFANTRAMVTRLTTRLSNRGFSCVALSGELTQSERSHALQAMRDGRARVCVATDVAARGIDLPNLELVIHAELPTNPEILVHRSGRTGRAGRKGVSVMIVPPKMRRRGENLLKWGKLTATWAVPPTADEIAARDEERLMADPVWETDFTEAETAFAARLLATHGANKIAAAYFRLYQGGQAAGEDLAPFDPSAPPTRPERPERKERAPFGPSRWFRVDLGRNQKAEARWLLPMLCKAGDITKREIGAIRILPDETFVELAEPAVAGFLKAIGPEMSLENQATLSAVDGVPQISERGARPARKPRPEIPDAPVSAPAPKPRESRPKPQARPADSRPPAPKQDKKATAPRKAEDRPPAEKRGEKPRKPKAEWDQPKPRGGAGAARKSGPGKPGKPPFKKGKPDGDKPQRSSAADPSKRFTPPGKSPSKPRKPGKPARGGAAPPKRK